jgi:hypothetical protein
MVGDVYTAMANVNAANYLEVAPIAGREYVIHNIFHENDIELKLVDGGGNELAFFEEAGKNFLTNMYIHLASTQYLRIYNRAVSSQRIGADGIITKDT